MATSGGTPRARAIARARNVLPAPRSPERSTRSPGASVFAISAPSRVVSRRVARRRSSVTRVLRRSEAHDRARGPASEEQRPASAEGGREIAGDLGLDVLGDPDREEQRAVRQEARSLVGAERDVRAEEQLRAEEEPDAPERRERVPRAGGELEGARPDHL